MRIQVHRTEYREVEVMRDLYRQELNCQIIRDSLPFRGLADLYLIVVEGRVGGYGAVSNKFDVGRLVEFHTLPHSRGIALFMFRELLAASAATSIEAQTNNPLMLVMLHDCATNITSEKILFHDAFVTQIACPNGIFRRITPQDAPTMFPHQSEPVGNWGVEANGTIVATGDFLCHYNPPYGDVHMEVVESARGRGFGSYLVQELKRVCYEAGRKPVARCDPGNVRSRRTLEKAGLLPCGLLLAGEVRLSA